MMKKLMCFFLLALLSLSGCFHPNDKSKRYKIGIINISTGLDEFIVGFKEGLAENGLIEGRNVTFLYKGPIDKNEVNQELQNLKAEHIDLLYTLTTPATKMAAGSLKGTGIPIVFAPVFSPVDAGLIYGNHDIGRNLTGVQVRGSTQKALEILASVKPGLREVFVPFHVSDKAAQLTVEDLHYAAEKLGVNLTLANVTSLEELDAVLAEIPASAQAVFLTHSHLILSRVNEIVAAATARKIPVASSAAHYKEGVMLSYSIEYARMGHQASRLAGKLLSGIEPDMLPVETGEYFLAVNLITADQIGLEIPYHILSQADFIIREPLKTLD